MKNLFYLLFSFLSLVLSAQKISILDSIDHRPIAYAEIVFEDNSYFTDSLGRIEITDNKVFPLRIKKVGYKDKVLSKWTNTILLSPKVIDIEEVEIKNPKYIEYDNKKLRKNTTLFHINTSIGIIINGEKDREGRLTELRIPIKRIYDNNTLLKVDFYKIENGKISNSPINSESVFAKVGDLKNRTDLVLPLKKYKVFFKEKVLVSIRIIDETGKTETTLGKPSIQFYNAKQKGDIYFYNIQLEQWIVLGKNMSLINLSYTVSY